MDVSRAPAAKCRSDFSIERILSEETREHVDTSSWVYCTRYRPPKLPRAASSSRIRRAGRHARVPFTGAQAAALEAAYARAPYLAPPALRALAAALQLRDDRIKIWFQNRRARDRREKCVSITPPHAVALPPTALQTSISSAHWLAHDLPHAYDLSQDKAATVDTRESPISSSYMPFDQSHFDRSGSISETSDERPDTELDIET